MTTENKANKNGITRREAVLSMGGVAAGAALASGGFAVNAVAAEEGSRAVKKEVGGKMTTTISLDWDEVYFTNCPMVSASNIDQELGWCKTDFKAVGIEYSYFRSRRETDWYPHYIHNPDNLIRFGGLYPPIQVHADMRRTRLLGATWVYEGGCIGFNPPLSATGLN